MFGEIIGAGIGGIHDTSNAIGQGLFSAWSQAKSRSDWRKSLQRGPTYAVQGLRRAGINPLYAYGKGFNAGSFSNQASGVSQASGAGMNLGAQIGAGIMSATKKGLDLDNVRKGAERDLVVAQTSAARESARHSAAQAGHTKTLNELDRALVHSARAVEQIDKTEAGKVLRWINRASRAIQGKDQGVR